MRHIYFTLTNLKNDKLIGMFPSITSQIILDAMSLYLIELEDIGISVEELLDA